MCAGPSPLGGSITGQWVTWWAESVNQQSAVYTWHNMDLLWRAALGIHDILEDGVHRQLAPGPAGRRVNERKGGAHRMNYRIFANSFCPSFRNGALRIRYQKNIKKTERLNMYFWELATPLVGKCTCTKCVEKNNWHSCLFYYDPK